MATPCTHGKLPLVGSNDWTSAFDTITGLAKVAGLTNDAKKAANTMLTCLLGRCPAGGHLADASGDESDVGPPLTRQQSAWVGPE